MSSANKAPLSYRERVRAEKQQRLEAYEREQAAERDRKAARSMFQRIEEANSFEDVREILHDLARIAGLEL